MTSVMDDASHANGVPRNWICLHHPLPPQTGLQCYDETDKSGLNWSREYRREHWTDKSDKLERNPVFVESASVARQWYHWTKSPTSANCHPFLRYTFANKPRPYFCTLLRVSLRWNLYTNRPQNSSKLVYQLNRSLPFHFYLPLFSKTLQPDLV